MKHITDTDKQLIASCKEALEGEYLFTIVDRTVGEAVRKATDMLPDKVVQTLAVPIEATLEKAMHLGSWTVVPGQNNILNSELLHLGFNTVAGAFGGFFGLVGASIEMPITTMTTLRSISCVAADEGFDPRDPAVRTACIGVLALGGAYASDDHNTNFAAYWAFRAQLAHAVQAALKWTEGQVLPALAEYLTKVASRFAIQLAERRAVSMVPIVGAVAGAGVNGCILHEFQCKAHAHFALERLIGIYGEGPVRGYYQSL